jgi:molybdate transport system substrate-binding protein
VTGGECERFGIVPKSFSLVALLLALLAGLAGCGEDEETAKPRLTVSAAASLKTAFEEYAKDFGAGTARFSFAGSDELAAQIRQGVKPDVYAAANIRLPDQLFRDGLVEKPTIFAGNRLVIAVPSGSGGPRSIEDLGREGLKLVVGAESVPVGSYARDVLTRLPAGTRDAILANVRSEEPDVAGIVGKLTQGAADAGFVYITDVVAAGGKLKAIELPEELHPTVRYGAAVVRGAPEPEAAKEFIDGLLEDEGLGAMERAGFLPAG